MTDADDLRARLRRIDPAPADLDPPVSRPAPDLMERIMTTPLLDHAPSTAQAPRRRYLVAAAAALVLAGGSLAALTLGGEDAKTTPKQAKATTVSLALPGGNSISSCAPFSVTFLKDMSPAFSGTVTSVEAGSITLTVDHWYAGGTADQVKLALPPDTSSASLDGITFEQGKRYFVTAAQGTVNGCGYTGLATPDLERSFNEAFPGS